MKLSIKSSVGAKLIGGFLIVVAMSALIGGISYYQFKSTETLVSDEVMKKAEARHLSAQIILKSNFVFGLVNEYLVTTKERRKVALRIIISDGIRTLWEYLHQVSNQKLTLEEKEMFSKLEILFRGYSDLTKRVLRKYDINEKEEGATETLVDEFHEVHFRFVTLLQNFNSIETRVMYDSWDFARSKIHTIQILILTLSGIALILGIILGVVSTRMITVPVGRLRNTLEEYGNGNFDVRADIIRSDEIGYLAERVNVMLDLIEKYADELRQSNRDLMKRNEELDQNRRQLQVLNDTTPDAVFSCTSDGRIVNVNRTCLEMFGYSREEMLTLNAYQLCGEESSRGVIEEKIDQAFRGYSLNFEWLCMKKNNEELPAIARLRKMQIGEDIYILAVVTDITEQKRGEDEKKKLEAQLLHAQRMEAVGTLAGGVAHDFNNVLQAVSGYVQLLLMRKGEEDPDLNYLNQIDKSIQRAAKLIQQLLVFSRKVESKLEPVDLNQEVLNVHKLLMKTIPKMVDIELRLTGDIETINADPIQLEQIIMNLAVNARDAMPDGGKFVIETENVVLDKNYSKVHLGSTPGKYVLLVISDTGSGMDMETVKHIFEPFYTTKEVGQGTGLGLATVYGIVKDHGGYIMCYSEPGQGTTFKIYLPVLKGEGIEREPEHEEVEDIRGGDETILLVDDEEDILAIGCNILEKYGYTTIRVDSGERALEVYMKEGARIDLVIMDLGMPGMGGHKCLQELLKIVPEIKVIIASGYSANGRVKETLKAGASGFIGKPYRLAEMLKKVREVLDAK